MTKNILFGFRSVSVISVILSICYVDSLKVSIFYESLCYDSIKFISQQLYPHFEQLKPFMDVELVPYGKALHERKGDTYEFFCQHGHAECAGNKHQSCLLAQKIPGEKHVTLIYCIMTSHSPASFSTSKDCAQETGYDVDLLTKCVNSPQADMLLAENGNKTWAITGNIAFVPTIVYDDQFNKVDQEQSLIDFAAVVCSKIVHVNKPRLCDTKRLPELFPAIEY